MLLHKTALQLTTTVFSLSCAHAVSRDTWIVSRDTWMIVSRGTWMVVSRDTWMIL